MAAPRSAKLQLGRPTLFRPFTSVTTPAQDTKTPEFEFVTPRTEAGFILLPQCQFPTRRFVFMFLDKDFAQTDFERFIVETQLAGASSSEHPLALVIRVDPDGKQALCTGLDYRAAVEGGSSPTYKQFRTQELVGIEPEFLRRLDGTFAVAAPIELPLEAIAALEAKKPRELPILGTGMGIGVKAEANQSPAAPDWVFPVVDPILIAENLTRKFFEACDNFLALSQPLDRPPPRNETEKKAREDLEVLRLKKTVFDNLVALQKAPSLADSFSDAIRSDFPRAFEAQHRETLEELVFERELAAFQLIAWLESEAFTTADDWWPRNGGKPDPSYEPYVRAVMNAMSRLAESDRGVSYLMDVRNRIDGGLVSVEPPPGPVHVASDFVFRTSTSSSEQRVLAIKVVTGLFGTWAAFVTAGVAVHQRVFVGKNPSTSLLEDLKAFADRLSFVYDGGFLTVEVGDVPVEKPVPGSLKKSVISIPVPEFKMSAVRKGFEKVESVLPSAHVTRVLAILNFGVAFQAFRSKWEEEDARGKNMLAADLAAASLGVADQVAALPALERFRSRMAGKINMGSGLLGNRVAGTLGLLGAVASLTNAGFATAKEFDQGDWDEGLAHMTEGFGAVLTGVGSTIILVSGTTGPFALWTIGIGTAVTLAGFFWSVFAADTELDQMLKFSAFGKQAAQATKDAPGWSQCAASFSEWNPETPDGLLRQLRAFQQIFYSFEVAGATSRLIGPSASDGVLRIFPSSMRVASTFEIDYVAVYAVPNARDGSAPVTHKGKARVIVPKTVTDTLTFENEAGHYQTSDAIDVHKDGDRDVFDVRLRLVVPLANKAGTPLELESLTCKIRLLVPGQGTAEGNDTLVVPTTAKGPNRVSCRTVREHSLTDERQNSLTVK